MVPATTPFIGFSGEVIMPIGQISLSVKIGYMEHSTSTQMNFVVVRSPSPYNGIIGRPKVRKIQTVPSTAHGMSKFPVPGGKVTLRSGRLIPLECTMVSGPEVQHFASTRVMKQRIKVAIDLEYPKQTIAIGSTLTEDGRNELCDLLRRNLDIFAWKPANITGVPRHVAEHQLNVREGCPPVRQKKRSQAPGRNKAIQEEVEKLVEAVIMKEVHYQSWLANPEELPDPWTLFMDGSSCVDGSRAGLIFTNLEGTNLTYALRFEFKATNNEVDYKTLIAGLRIAEQMGIKKPSSACRLPPSG
uniref:Reverse transcriptase domain-containing protein n=1 Tax=Tanacetum cinerariifolium TaxID=118510 RepID=A0A6L2JGV3_TANCI|nr:reverse transcriptase domain-containing protein [Tanacetum cinerariifolium]